MVAIVEAVLLCGSKVVTARHKPVRPELAGVPKPDTLAPSPIKSWQVFDLIATACRARKCAIATAKALVALAHVYGMVEVQFKTISHIIPVPLNRKHGPPFGLEFGEVILVFV